MTKLAGQACNCVVMCATSWSAAVRWDTTTAIPDNNLCLHVTVWYATVLAFLRGFLLLRSALDALNVRLRPPSTSLPKNSETLKPKA